MGRGGQSDPSIRPNEVHRERKFKKVPGSKGFSLSKNTRAPGASDPACPKEVAFPGLYQGLWQNQTLGSQTTGRGMDRTPAHRVGCVWTDQHLRNPSPTSQVLSFEPRQGLSLGPLHIPLSHDIIICKLNSLNLCRKTHPYNKIIRP